MVNPSPTRSQSARACVRHSPSASVRRLSSGVCVISRPHAGTATNAGVWSKLTLRLNGRGETCANTRQPSACSTCACSMMRSARDGSRLFSASWFQVHATPAAPHQRATRSMSTQLAVDLLDPGEELEDACVARRAAEHLDERAELVVVGGAAGHRVPVPVLVDERRRQAEGAGRERVGEHRGHPVALLGRWPRGPTPRRPSRRRAGSNGRGAGRRAPRCRAPAGRPSTRRTTPSSTGSRSRTRRPGCPR